MSGGVSIAEVAFHLAGGSADDWARVEALPGAAAVDWMALGPERWKAAGLGPERRRRLEQARDGRRARDEARRCREQGIRLVAHGTPDYPETLRRAADAPLVLAVRGRWPVTGPVLAVVGARAATAYGRQATRSLAGAAARGGVAIVSGLARGVDRFALEAALDEDGWPVGVVGCGIDVVYPREHRELQEQVARRGTLVSQFPLGQRPAAFAFPRRNKIIAALASRVLVVEAGQRSGSLITAGYALELGRDVLAVPGAIDAELSRGTNKLIEDGAVPIIDVRSLQAQLPQADGTPRPRSAHPLLAALDGRALTVDELAQETGLPVARVRSSLIGLELTGAVRHGPGGRYARS